MLNNIRHFAAVLLIAVLFGSLPAAAAQRPPRPNRIVHAVKRVVDTLVPWLYTRISPPGGTPTQDETPTDPTKTQKVGS